MRTYAHHRRGFVELLLLLVLIIFIVICAGQCSGGKGTGTTVQQQQQARRSAIADRLEALRKRRAEVSSMSDQQVKARMLFALDKEIAELEKTLREEF
jgi:hypothetical protein